MNTDCETHESLISAWMDEELGRADSIEMLDHFVRCRSCRAFYRDSRALEGLLPAEKTDSPSRELWERIEGARRTRAPFRVRTWALKAAALAVVAVGLALALVPRLSVRDSIATGRTVGSEIEVELGSRSGEMTEARFFEIATEVLEADGRYRRAMYEVMGDVIDGRETTEGGGDGVEIEVIGEESDQEGRQA